ncbi:MAG: hypothetical protein HQL18_05480 [Candidatus Omnitrophica bacterium]|nr:hypothetical protein [Candidatus Omnitrophota bacterium]
MMTDSLPDVRPPVAIPSDWWWLWIFVAVAIIFALVWGALRFLRHRRNNMPPVPPKSPWEIAFESFDALEKGKLASEGRIKEYYSLLSDIVRRYIEDRFAIRAPEMTTEEFMDRARRSAQLSDAHKMFLRDFLDASDRVKFARFVPSMDGMKDSLRLARRFVQETVPVEKPVDSQKTT